MHSEIIGIVGNKGVYFDIELTVHQLVKILFELVNEKFDFLKTLIFLKKLRMVTYCTCACKRFCAGFQFNGTVGCSMAHGKVAELPFECRRNLEISSEVFSVCY